MTLADAVATARRRKLTGKFWHQGPTRHPLVSCLDPAAGAGRYHQTGEPGVWYASNREQGAWAELFRHFVDEGIDPFEIRRRVGRVSIDLQVLDLTDEQTRSHLGVDETDLVSEDYVITHAIAVGARDAGFDAILAPAAALPGCHTLAVFVHALPNVDAERSEVRQPPPRLADLLAVIRPHENVPNAVRRLLKTLEGIGAEEIRRRRR
ncbi:RES family NAD+ phosphorylase [Mycolicibacterium chlorophenolicum]|uniref:RES family NAD+ phosphorylase n=1 Tax=Mycolicibacterium chlorophenolicum TaxID=37916 RepID=UPI0009E1E43F|nr:RES family NAD+ phosphorylase [Mycolicibacterium chlorophenolicum]